MVRGATPTFVFTLSDESVNLLEAESVYVTIEQPGTSITKSGQDILVEQHSVSVWLSQKESLMLKEGKAEAQLNWLYTDDVTGDIKRAATKLAEITIEKQLLRRVIS